MRATSNLSPVWTLSPSIQFSLREKQWTLIIRKSRGSSLQHLQAPQGQRQDMILSLAPSRQTSPPMCLWKAKPAAWVSVIASQILG